VALVSGAQRAVVASVDRGAEWLRAALGLDEGQSPFPWQSDLLRRLLDGEPVTALDIPTGLGKTATMAIWLVARALGASLPRRLVYVVDRRAVVDQATEVAEALRAWVQSDRGVADALGLAQRPLPISTLRGQHVDNREWLDDPTVPAIVVGTVDMVGSRLLFSGYGVSPKMRPYHAGVLGADTLLVLDEAHLVPAFEDLLRCIEGGADKFGPKNPALRAVIPRFSLLSLSATGRRTGAPPLTLTEADHAHPVVRKRLLAPKSLSTVYLGDSTEHRTRRAEAAALTSELARRAWKVTNDGAGRVRCLVFCDAREDAVGVARELRAIAKDAKVPEPAIELLVGARRVRERTDARTALARLGFLAGAPVKLERAVFLVATSAGEVGVDLDADHMVCDLVPWERMVQRLGRVNRRGEGNASVTVVAGSEPEPSRVVVEAQKKRDDAEQAQEELEALTRKLRASREAAKDRPKGKRQTSAEKSREDERKRAEKELATCIRRQRKSIAAYKDADAAVAADFERELAKARALRRLIAVVGEGGDLSPASLRKLAQRADLAEALTDASTDEPLRPELTRALVDAWSMTSLDEHPGRPEIEPWLRGWTPSDPPQTTMVWRRYLPVPDHGALDPRAARRFFEAAPPHASEQLDTEVHTALDWLVKRAAATTVDRVRETRDQALRDTSVVAIALSSRGDVTRAWTLADLRIAADSKSPNGKRARSDLERCMAGATLILDARLGGLRDGLLDGGEASPARSADDGAAWPAREFAPGVPITGFRVTRLDATQRDEALNVSTSPGGEEWVRRLEFVEEVVDGDPARVLAIDGWEGESATEDDRAEAARPQRLDEHQTWAEECAARIARRVGLEGTWALVLTVAAALHDEGKRALRWQRAFRAPGDGVYAKTTGPIDFAMLDGYRHELGSLPHVEADLRVRDLPEGARELVLHLVATHHGYGRPSIGTSGCDDAPPSVIEARAAAVALRFAQLSRRWGPWGLAWWESLLRAADQEASRRNRARGSLVELGGRV
jgi:CRISPR-associated endonuclease/helicase Cas3